MSFARHLSRLSIFFEYLACLAPRVKRIKYSITFQYEQVSARKDCLQGSEKLRENATRKNVISYTKEGKKGLSQMQTDLLSYI